MFKEIDHIIAGYESRVKQAESKDLTSIKNMDERHSIEVRFAMDKASLLKFKWLRANGYPSQYIISCRLHEVKVLSFDPVKGLLGVMSSSYSQLSIEEFLNKYPPLVGCSCTEKKA